MLAYFAALSVLASAALGAITPTSPDSTTKVDVGGTVNALWNVDTTGTWKNMFVQLMTGDNLNVSFRAQSAFFASVTVGENLIGAVDVVRRSADR